MKCRRGSRYGRVLTPWRVCVVAIALRGSRASGQERSTGACETPTAIRELAVADAIGAKWNPATSTLAYGKPGADKHYATYLSDSGGTGERRLVVPGWRSDRHHFPVAWHPGGQYLVVTVEKDEHGGSSFDATPGYGAYSDYWIVARDGSRAWILVALPNVRDRAITHAAFSPDGTRFVWTERVKAPNLFNASLLAGSYEFRVGTFVESPYPHLVDIQTFIPGGKEQGGEVESMADDDRTIAFYSTFRSKNLLASRIYTMDTKSGDIRELTTDSWAQAPTFTPDGRHVVYMTGSGADIFPWSLQGADWWIMDRDGENKQRLTFMNKRGDSQSVGKFRLAGSLSFVSNYEFFGDVMTKSLGLVGKIVHVDIDSTCVH